ncbi:MAG: hypothetical protein EBU12_07975 [Microbacteriaceae bacterium]|jgi:hypothetical protein|nr:hypothetical protein [Microbacteriaceae bacterium]
MSSLVVKGNASGSGAVTLQSANTNSSLTQTLPATDAITLGYLNTPISSTTTTVATSDVGKVISLSAGITIPDATFSAGDIVSVYNNTASSLTITCSITTAYVAGTNTDVASMTLASRGVATILFLSGTVCVVSGNVS